MNTPQYSTNLLMKHGPLQYSVDVSMLSDPPFEHVCDDGIVPQFGFVLVSAKSGREMRMRIVSEHRDADNDITHWVLQSHPEDARRLSTPVLTVTVWNT